MPDARTIPRRPVLTTGRSRRTRDPLDSDRGDDLVAEDGLENDGVSGFELMMAQGVIAQSVSWLVIASKLTPAASSTGR
jgi:hypothetical protein